LDRIVVRGSTPLRGQVEVSGSKNSTLALMAAALLASGETQLRNVPRLRDVDTMLEILRALDWGRGHAGAYSRLQRWHPALLVGGAAPVEAGGR
jgi:UDP-N-acetylglucosamine 1-carboxyvinyltransferase